MDLLSTISATEAAVQLFLDNQFDLAEQKMAEFAHNSFYHALGHGAILFIRASMSFERADLEKAIAATIDGCALINRSRARHSLAQELLRRLKGNSLEKNLTDEQMHAELCRAELLMARALLSFVADESFASIVRGAFRIRACFHAFKELHRMLATDQFRTAAEPSGNNEAQRLRRQFEAGVRGGFGLFNLVLSSMPARLGPILNLVGFSGEKFVGLSELLQSATMEDTLRSPLATMSLLCHQLVVSFLIGSELPDLELCDRLLKPLASKFPNGAIILFLRARLQLVRGQLDEALQLYRRSIRSQNVYRQFHHICHWELTIGNVLLLHWNRAAWHAKKLLNENRWSKCVYAYFLAILIDSDRTVKRRKEVVSILMRQVPEHRLKIAGKSIPIEKFCERRALKWLECAERQRGGLLLPQIEFLYMWNGFSLLERCPRLVRPLLEFVDAEWDHWQFDVLELGLEKQAEEEESRLLWTFLRAVCQKTMGQLAEAALGFEAILQSEFQLPQSCSSGYLLPNACLELALTRMGLDGGDQEHKNQQQKLLAKALSYRGYALETKLHFRVHSAIQRLN